MKCKMCGENESTLRIWSPNYDDDTFWDVCEDCDLFIKDSQINHIKEHIKQLKLRNSKHKRGRE